MQIVLWKVGSGEYLDLSHQKHRGMGVACLGMDGMYLEMGHRHSGAIRCGLHILRVVHFLDVAVLREGICRFRDMRALYPFITSSGAWVYVANSIGVSAGYLGL